MGKKSLYIGTIVFVVLIGIFCLYSLFYIGNSQSEEISIAQTIDWHDFDYQSQDEMARDAELVIVGTVVSTRAYRDDVGEGSLVEVAVDSVLQGNAADSVTVFQYGNDEVRPPDEFPLMQTGQSYKFYLYMDGENYYRVIGGYLGAEKIE